MEKEIWKPIPGWDGMQSNGEPNLTVGLMFQKSFKPLGVSRFTGIGLHAGIWAGSAENWPNLGVFGGFVESKLNDSTLATREWVATIALRIFLAKKLIQIVPHFSHGTHNYLDYGITAGVRVNDGIYVGLLASRMMHIGGTVTVSIFK